MILTQLGRQKLSDCCDKVNSYLQMCCAHGQHTSPARCSARPPIRSKFNCLDLKQGYWRSTLWLWLAASLQTLLLPARGSWGLQESSRTISAMFSSQLPRRHTAAVITAAKTAVFSLVSTSLMDPRWFVLNWWGQGFNFRSDVGFALQSQICAMERWTGGAMQLDPGLGGGIPISTSMLHCQGRRSGGGRVWQWGKEGSTFRKYSWMVSDKKVTKALEKMAGM